LISHWGENRRRHPACKILTCRRSPNPDCELNVYNLRVAANSRPNATDFYDVSALLFVPCVEFMKIGILRSRGGKFSAAHCPNSAEKGLIPEHAAVMTSWNSMWWTISAAFL